MSREPARNGSLVSFRVRHEAHSTRHTTGSLIGELAAELRAEHARLAQLRESNGISATPRYTNPKRITVHISSPQLAQYTALIEELDRLMTVMDALWLTGVNANQKVPTPC